MSAALLRTSIVTKIATVIFSASLLGGYVWYSQVQFQTALPVVETAKADPAFEAETPARAESSGERGEGGDSSEGLARPERPPTFMLSSKSISRPAIGVPTEILLPDIKLDANPHGLDFLKKETVLDVSKKSGGVKVEVTSPKGDMVLTLSAVPNNLPSLLSMEQSLAERVVVTRRKLMMASSKMGVVELPRIEMFVDWLAQQGKSPMNSELLKVHPSPQGELPVVPSASVVPPNPDSGGSSKSPETLPSAASQYPLAMPPSRTFHSTGPAAR